MRATGYRTVDALVDWLADPEQPPIRRAEPAALQRRVVGPAALEQLLAAAPRLERELTLSAHERLRRAR
jgi:hypothetical protein